jgi:hypothetical protein
MSSLRTTKSPGRYNSLASRTWATCREGRANGGTEAQDTICGVLSLGGPAMMRHWSYQILALRIDTCLSCFSGGPSSRFKV